MLINHSMIEKTITAYYTGANQGGCKETIKRGGIKKERLHEKAYGTRQQQ